MSRARLTAISGLGNKGPACFLVEAAGARLLLDLGYGPQPGLLPDVSQVGAVDAIVLSHGHRDHAGGFKLRAQVGNPPVYASEIVCRMLAPDLPKETLPLHGTADILGIRVTTGRSGHAPGGIWLHFDLNGGLLYMGDNCDESILYEYDPPPRAEVAIIDASYGDYDTPLAKVRETFDRMFDAGPALLPIPPAGRGPEIALHVLESRSGMPSLDDAMRESLTRLAGADRECLKPGTHAAIERLSAQATAIDEPAGVMLAGIADATAGAAAKLVERWEAHAAPAMVFTGYVPPGTPAERLTKSGRGTYMRWNVHPLLSHNTLLVARVGARIVLPAFGDAARHQAAWVSAFSPARVVTGGAVEW